MVDKKNSDIANFIEIGKAIKSKADSVRGIMETFKCSMITYQHIQFTLEFGERIIKGCLGISDFPSEIPKEVKINNQEVIQIDIEPSQNISTFEDKQNDQILPNTVITPKPLSQIGVNYCNILTLEAVKMTKIGNDGESALCELNGCGVINKDLLNTRYPYLALDFYEKHFSFGDYKWQLVDCDVADEIDDCLIDKILKFGAHECGNIVLILLKSGKEISVKYSYVREVYPKLLLKFLESKQRIKTNG